MRGASGWSHTGINDTGKPWFTSVVLLPLKGQRNFYEDQMFSEISGNIHRETCRWFGDCRQFISGIIRRMRKALWKGLVLCSGCGETLLGTAAGKIGRMGIKTNKWGRGLEVWILSIVLHTVSVKSCILGLK